MKNLTEKKKKAKKMINRISSITAGAAMATMLYTTNVYASGAEVVTAPLNNLKNLVIAIIGAVGVIILAKNVICPVLPAAGFEFHEFCDKGHRCRLDYGGD